MKKILIAHDLLTPAMEAVNVLRRSDLSVFTASTNDELLRIHIEQEANLIITTFGLPGLATETLIPLIRQSEALRKVSIVLLCDGTPEQRARSNRLGVNTVMSMPVDILLFAAAVRKLLDVAARRSYRVVLNVVVDGKRDNQRFLCDMENISFHGMLIRTTESLAPDDRISCSFYLPDGTRVGASGVVVRAVRQGSGAGLYGVCFEALAAEAEAALSSFLNREVRLRPAYDSPVTPLYA
jgi:CheY-like chemotaxis protein